MTKCTHCNGTGHAPQTETLEQRIDRTEARLLAACEAKGLYVTGDQRVSTKDAAALLGLSAEGLKQAKSEDRAPKAHPRGVGRKTRSSYRVRDIAIWLEQDYDTT
ncbi:hypothetical protein D3C85_989650 [compost metagenome]|jgi:hypothetical protein